jgi:hypothetical protein
MQIEFDVKLEPDDMFKFNMYQMYTGIHGWLSIAIAIVVLTVAVRTMGSVEILYTVVYFIFGIVFLFYVPVSLKLRSKRSITSSEVLSKPLHYCVDEKGFTVSQGEASAKLPWEQIYKMVATKSNVLVYSNRTNAYVIPRTQLGENYEALAGLANSSLEKFRVKMK